MKFGQNFGCKRVWVVAILMTQSWIASAQDIVLGQTASFSNPVVGALHKEYSAGIQLAIKRVNESGGARQADRRLALMVQLKCFQYLHYFCTIDQIPPDRRS